jgi:uncharacterized protein YaiI (UPF0178 family)
MPSTNMSRIFVDADACPVKDEIYRVAKRYGFQVTLVSNSSMRVPSENWIELVVVEGRLDAADNWIVEQVTESDIVITGDIPLAARCLKKGAHVIDLRGGMFTENRISEALVSREILGQLRDLGTMTTGPAPFQARDRSRFLQRLDQTIQAVRKKNNDQGPRT